jgi:hypothetical protein
LAEFFGHECGQLVLEAFEFLVGIRKIVRVGADAELVVSVSRGFGPGWDRRKKNS